MMTGYGYETRNAEKIISRDDEDCCGRSQFLSGIGLSNSDNYGLMGDCYHPSQCNSSIASASKMPRVSISDEELYQALNISPLYSNIYQPSTDCPINGATLSQTTMSEMEHPSTSCLHHISSPFEKQNVYLPSNVIESMVIPVRGVPSPALSITSAAPTASSTTAEEEDLEVEFINTSHSAQHVDDDIDIFLHCSTSDNEFLSSRENSRNTTRTGSNPTPSSRPAYAQKLSASSLKNSIDVNRKSATSPLFLETNIDPAGFTPLLTPKSDALLQRKLNESRHSEEHYISGKNYSSDSSCPSTSRPLHRFPNYCKQPLDPSTSTIFDSSTECHDLLNPRIELGIGAAFQSSASLHSTPRKNLSLAESVSSKRSLGFEDFVKTSDTISGAKGEEIPITVADKLLSGIKFQSKTPEPPTISIEELLRSVSNHSTRRSATYQNFNTSLDSQTLDMETPQQGSSQTEEVLDDWETANDEDLTFRMEKLLKTVENDMKKEEDKMKAYNEDVPTTSDWDRNYLPNVLEIYDIPDYKMQDDVVKALEIIGFGDCVVKWIERKIVLALFENAARAKSCLLLPGHEWLRFRKLSSSPRAVQEAAKANSSSLSATRRRGQTNASVARRMVENVLGKKSSASAEQRKEERKQIADAKAAKKNSVNWD